MSEELLEKLYDIRQEMAVLEKQEKVIRERLQTAMERQGLKTYTAGAYKLSIRDMSRESLCKKDCPEHVWKQYCKKISYPVIKVSRV